MAEQAQTQASSTPVAKKRERLSPEELDKRSAELNAKVQKERETLVQKTLDFIETNYKDMDATTRNDLLDEIVKRVGSVKTVAAHAKLRVARSAVMAEEKGTMPRLTPPAKTGDAPNRNIMTQGDQNTSESLGGGK
jgi:hypothetical protein